MKRTPEAIALDILEQEVEYVREKMSEEFVATDWRQSTIYPRCIISQKVLEALQPELKLMAKNGFTVVFKMLPQSK